MHGTRALVWLAPLVGLVAVSIVYRDVYATEDGLYAGAEPMLAGLMVALPFAALTAGQAACAIGTHTSATVPAQCACAVSALVLTVISLLGVLWVV